MVPPHESPPGDSFLTTPWSLLSAISRPADASPEEEQFIATCEICWRPISDFVRAYGYDQREGRKIARRLVACLIAHRRSAGRAVARLPERIYIRESLKQFLAAETARRNARRRNSMLE